MNDLEERVSLAIRHFWETRQYQQKKQGGETGKRDYGNRAAVTGGAQLDGFMNLISMLLEDAEKSQSPVRVSEPHFYVFDEFRQASYAQRYELFCQRLIRERLYDGVCFLMSSQSAGLKGKYREPSEELGFRNFAISLVGRATAFAKQM